MKASRRFIPFLVAAVFVAIPPNDTPAQEPNESSGEFSPGDTSSKDEWKLLVVPFIWAVGVDMDMAAGPIDISAEIGFDDIIKNADGALQLHLELEKGRWRLFLDETWGKVGKQKDDLLLKGTIDMTFNLLEFGVGYDLIDRPTGKFGDGRLRLQPILGGRWTYMKPDIKLKRRPSISSFNLEESFDWLDLLVGVRFHADFAERWGFNLNTNIGGFGIGSSSELAWNVTALFNYDISDRHQLYFGYRHLDIDYDAQGILDADIAMSGPLIGFGFRF